MRRAQPGTRTRRDARAGSLPAVTSQTAVRRAAVEVAGHRISYQVAGPDSGPLVVLLHGLASDSTTWEHAIGPLAQRGCHVVAPDLLGHGESDKPPAGYLLHEFADGLSDFLSGLGHRTATLAGHSFGGAVAMQTAFQYPDVVDRLVLVSAGGLGREVNIALRAATLPGSGAVVRALTSRRTAAAVRAIGVHRRISPQSLANIRRAARVLGSPPGRRAFLHTLRGVIEFGGQRGSMIEMRRLAEHIPILLVWSERDPIIPVTHAYAVQAHLPGSRLEVLPGRTHEPHRRYADRFASVVADFVGA